MAFGLAELARLVDLLAIAQVPMKSDFIEIASRRAGSAMPDAAPVVPGVWQPSGPDRPPANAAGLALLIDYALDRAELTRKLRSREDADERLKRAKMLAQNAREMAEGLKQLGIDRADFSDGLRRELVLAMRAANKLVRRLDGRGAILPTILSPEEAGAGALMAVAEKYVANRPGTPSGETLTNRTTFVAIVLEVAGVQVARDTLRKRLTPRSKHAGGQNPRQT